MRNAILGVLAAAALAGPAAAADYVVVKSTDPAIRPGMAFDGGDALPLAPGQTVTLMAAAGEIAVLRGGPSGAVAPARKAGQADAGKVEALRAVIDPPPPGRQFGGKRSGVCPDPAGLKTVDDIIAVQSAGCRDAALEALNALASAAAS